MQVIAIQKKMDALQIEANKLCQTNPDLLDVEAEQLRQELLDIEFTTYTELMRLGRLTEKLPSLLEDILKPQQEKSII
ncbi:sodium/hydrogen exchanger [Stanieria sp. NIES-3757]|nr:sodium/hydrogen exchanger [Stanieria sp. NIES-3757]